MIIFDEIIISPGPSQSEQSHFPDGEVHMVKKINKELVTLSVERNIAPR